MSLTTSRVASRLGGRPLPRWGVASALTALVVGLILALMVTTTVVDVRRERSTFREGLEQRGDLLARTWNDVLFDPLYFTDVAALRDIATVLEGEPDILYVQIFRRDGKLVVDTAQGEYTLGRVDDEFVASALDRQRTVFRSQNGSFEVTTAIGTTEGGVIGGFRFGFSEESVDAQIRDIAIERIWQSVALILAGAVIAILISRQTAEPLKKLATIAGEIGQGKLNTPVQVRGPSEIVSLGNALETMRVDLRRLYEELTRSNADLEQFAYVASHDLQEPLRAIVGFTKMLEQDYRGRLDADADTLISRTVNAAVRMQDLINDLLAYSRVGRGQEAFQPTNLETIMDQALENLQAAINESSATVTRGPLPTVVTSGSMAAQVLNNLIANAIKFRGEETPSIRVSAERTGNELVLSVQDNGIGIDPQYVERIFVMFQRLHGRTEYEGTGIGLAICKKAVERLGGRIWVDSQPGEGATFYFSIPIAEGEKVVAAPPRSETEAILVAANAVPANVASANVSSEGGGL